MLLKTTLLRAGGSFHEIDGKTYHFTPVAADGPHVCEVTAQSHVKRFLAIDGFEIADEVFPTPAPDTPMIQMDRDNRAAATAAALAALPLTVSTPIAPAADAPAWVPPPAASILDGTDAVAEPAPAMDYDAMDDDALKLEFMARFGKPPHPKAKRPKIIEYLLKPADPAPAGG